MTTTNNAQQNAPLMRGSKKNILDAIGNTPIVKLNKIAAHVEPYVQMYVKCEFMNPGGSVKDRIGVHILDVAEREGKIAPGGTIIEATSGNTGMGLAIAAATRGYKCIFVMADKQSEEKRIALRSVGAKVVICPTNVEPEDPRSYYSVAHKLATTTPNSFYSNQYHNPANPESHYLGTGPELWEQCGDELDVFITSMGTGGTISGISKYLREKNPNVKIVGVDPVGSIYYDLFYTGKMPTAHSYYVEGIGEDFMPSTMDMNSVDDIMQVNDKESFSMARRLIREEGLLCGGSCGAAVAGALKYAERIAKQKPEKPVRIVVLLPDSSSRYLSKFLNDEWLRDANLLDEDPMTGTVQTLLDRKSQQGVSSVYVAQKSEALGSVIDRMKNNGISQLPVLDGEKLLGMVSEVKLLNALVKGEANMKTPAGDLADLDGVATVERDTSIGTLNAHLARGKIAVVLDMGSVVGLLTKMDVIDHMMRH